MAPHGGTITVPRLPGNINEIWAAFKCDNCSALTVAMATARAGDGAILSDPAGWLGRMNHTQWYPVHSVGKDFPDVPQHIADAASEAYRCRSISALRTAVQLARSVVEATAKEKGITQGSIFSKINEMYNQRLIREHIKDGAHEVRHLGNDMAHGDFVSPVTSEETDLVLTLMSEILDEVFQSPARVAQARAARAAREAQSNGQPPGTLSQMTAETSQ